MEHKFYSITELEQLTGLNRRTIHYYIQEKVIPPPEGAGGAAKYSEDHVLRLALVKQMQQSHLKLSGIKEALGGLSLEEIRALSQAGKKRQLAAWDRQSLQNWLVDKPRPTIMYSTKEEDFSPRYSIREKHDSDATGHSLLHPEKEKTEATKKPSKRVNLLSLVNRSGAPKERSWERFEIAEGIEMNVRSDIARAHEADLKDIVIKLQKIVKGGFYES